MITQASFQTRKLEIHLEEDHQMLHLWEEKKDGMGWKKNKLTKLLKYVTKAIPTNKTING